jgi:DNA polymerase-3 subunit delta
MKVRADQLEDRLSTGKLSPIYLLTGNEPLQTTELGDAIRAAARKAGADERIKLQVEKGFNWSDLNSEADAMSLFASKRLIDLDVGDSKLGNEGSAALIEYAERPPGDDILLVTAGKFDRRVPQSKWFKAVERVGTVVQLWPIDIKTLPGWLKRRASSRGARLSDQAAQLIAERVEGNLLAAAQEVEMLVLLNPGATIEADDVRAAVADSSRYDIFALADCALAGDAKRTRRILEGLRREGVEPAAVSWVITRELRSLGAMHEALRTGQRESEVFAAHRVWEKRQPLVRRALKRLPEADNWRLLGLAQRVDRVIKGVIARDAWEDLTWLCLGLSGLKFDRVQDSLLT